MAKLDKLLEKAQEHLTEGEHVLASIQGTYEIKVAGTDGVRTGMFAATNKRLLFYAKKLGGYDLESFPYDHISSFEMSKGVMGHKMTFFASGNKVEMKWINKGDIPTFSDAVRSRMGKVSATFQEPPSGNPATNVDVVEQLRKFAALRDEGILTEEEFQAKKTQILQA